MNRSRVRHFGLLLLPLAFLPACGDDAVPAGTQEDSGSEEASESNASEVGTDASDSAEASSSSDTDADSGDTASSGTTTGGSGVPASGISVVNIEANQGTAEDIAIGANWAGPPERDIRLLMGRDTFVRINVSVDQGWTEREIRGLLTLYLANGETRVYDQIQTISGDSTETNLNSSFYFGLLSEAGETDVGTRFQFELLEVGNGDGGVAEGVHTSPADGPAEIGFEEWNMLMKVLYVPITYQGNEVPVDTPEGQTRLQVIDDHLFEQKPVTALESSVREPVVYNGTVSGLGSFLPFLSQLRQQDGAPSDLYYIGVVRYASDVAGIANYSARFNANHWPTQGDSGLARTIVHETGHNQNMPHVDCPGANYPAGQEPPGGYPYPDGIINRSGFGLLGLTLATSDGTYDYMGYCGPSWVSTYSWNQTWNIIAADNPGNLIAPPTIGRVLNHVVDGAGEEQWWISEERIDPETFSGNVEVTWVSPDGDERASLGMPARQSESSGLDWVQLPLPAGHSLEDFSEVQLRVQGVESVLSTSTLATP